MRSNTSLIAVLSVATACHDESTGPIAPRSPDLAVHSSGVWLVNSIADPGDGVCTNTECTLREAIAAAQDGERITFKNNVSGTIGLNAGELAILEDITIEGPGANTLTVDARAASRVFRVGGPAFANATISGLTITGGKTLNIGGGVFVGDNSQLHVIETLITGNSAAEGGGIAAEGVLLVTASTIAANDATFSGGGISADDPFTVSRSTISRNHAETHGGGIVISCSTIVCGLDMLISSSTITDNSANTGGGGVAIEFGAHPSAANTIIAGNHTFLNIDPTDEADCEGNGLVSLGNNLTTIDTGCDLADPTDVHVQYSQVFAFVLEHVLRDNGGPTPTHALIERGHAVDAGYCPGDSRDQRGFPRLYDDPQRPNVADTCDIGAYEWQPIKPKTKS